MIFSCLLANSIDVECTCITAYLDAALGEMPCDIEECESSSCFVIKQNYDAKTRTFKTPLPIPRSDGTNALRTCQARVYKTSYQIPSEDQEKFRKGKLRKIDRDLEKSIFYL